MYQAQIAAIVIIVALLGWQALKPRPKLQKNMNETAKVVLRNLIVQADKAGARIARLHLQELERVFNRTLVEYPNHELTNRLHWIITENMIQLLPEYLQSEERARAVLGPYQAQLEEIRRHLMSNKPDAAASAADKPFNWEQRNYFTL